VTTPRFIVSSGRCGSTLLSSLVGAHPSVLEVPEFFAALQPGAFPRGGISAEDFWGRLSRPRRASTVAVRHGIEPPEFKYPVDGGGVFNRQTGVPPLAEVCLPALADDPDALFRDLEKVVSTFPTAGVGVLYATLFGVLAEHFNKTGWVERSGGSIAYAGEIAACFEAAKFVHLYRDGCATALSMSRHVFFRMAILREILASELGYDPFDDGAPTSSPDRLPEDLQPLLPETFSPSALRELPMPLERFGRRWSAMVILGTTRLAALPRGRVFHLAYEDLVSSPARCLGEVFDFFEVARPARAWFDWAAAQVAVPPPSPPFPAARELARLRRACEPGERQIEKALAGD